MNLNDFFGRHINNAKTGETDQSALSLQERDAKARFYLILGLIVVLGGIVLIHNVLNVLGGKSLGSGASEPEAMQSASINESARQGTKLVKIKEKQPAIYLLQNGGTKLVVIGDAQASVYDVAAASSVALENVPADAFVSAAFIAGRDEIVIGGESGLGIWDLKSGKNRLKLNAAGGVETIAVSADGLMIAGISRVDEKLLLWETEKGKLLKQGIANRNSYRPTLAFKNSKTVLIYEISESRSHVLSVEVPSLKTNSGEWKESSEDSLRFWEQTELLQGGDTSRQNTSNEWLVYQSTPLREVRRFEDSANESTRLLTTETIVSADSSGVLKIRLLAGPENSVIASDNLKQPLKIAAVSGDGNFVACELKDKRILIWQKPS